MKLMSYPRRGGWTLLESLILVAIVGVLALVAVPAWTNARKRTEAEMCAANRQMIFQSLRTYCEERQVACTVANFRDIHAVRRALAPDDPTAPRYIKDPGIFCCPHCAGGEASHRLIRDAAKIVGIGCDAVAEHNL